MPLVLKVLRSGESRTFEDVTLGHYRLHSIADGIVTVGCHRFYAEEVERFAATL